MLKFFKYKYNLNYFFKYCYIIKTMPQTYGNDSFSGTSKKRQDSTNTTAKNTKCDSALVNNLEVDNSTTLYGPLTLNGGYNLNGYTTVVGYAPTNWSTAGAASYISLSTTSGVVNTTSSNALKIPDNAFIFRMIFTNNGTTLSPTTDSDFVNLYTSDTLNANSVNQTQINNGAAINVLNSVVNTGRWYPTPDSQGTLSGQNYVNVLNNTENVTGSLAVAITYYAFPSM
jgi:hypothetical protein